MRRPNKKNVQVILGQREYDLLSSLCFAYILVIFFRNDMINTVNVELYSQVYDVTPFMDDHPGGDEVLLAATGDSAITFSSFPFACLISP